jgi:hypothetical protein
MARASSLSTARSPKTLIAIMNKTGHCDDAATNISVQLRYCTGRWLYRPNAKIARPIFAFPETRIPSAVPAPVATPWPVPSQISPVATPPGGYFRR